MREYSSAGIIDNHSSWQKKDTRSIWVILHSFLSLFSKTESMEIQVPKNVYIRTKLLCDYLSEKSEVRLGISNFLMMVYLDFLESSIAKYNPKKIHEEMNRSHGYDETLLIHAYDKVYEYKKREGKKAIITIDMDKKDAEKGQLLLDEMEDLYGQAPTLEKMISTLWVNFIEDYKAGNNQKALNEIVRILRKNKEIERQMKGTR